MATAVPRIRVKVISREFSFWLNMDFNVLAAYVAVKLSYPIINLQPNNTMFVSYALVRYPDVTCNIHLQQKWLLNYFTVKNLFDSNKYCNPIR